MSSSTRAEIWVTITRGDRTLGKVRSRTSAGGSRRWYIDFGRRWAPRFLYSYRGIRFETRDFAVGVLSHIQVEVTKSRDLDDVLSELGKPWGSCAVSGCLWGLWRRSRVALRWDLGALALTTPSSLYRLMV